MSLFFTAFVYTLLPAPFKGLEIEASAPQELGNGSSTELAFLSLGFYLKQVLSYPGWL